MKRATTQEIIKRANTTKMFPGDWQHVYIAMQQLINDTQHYRTFRNENTICLYEMVDKEQGIAAGPVFSIDPPRVRANNYVQFAKALAKSGYKYFQTYSDNPLNIRLLEEAGYEVEIGDTEIGHKNIELQEISVSLVATGDE
jgi:hypothetical protein